MVLGKTGLLRQRVERADAGDGGGLAPSGVMGDGVMGGAMLSSDLAGKGDRECRAPAEDSPKPKIQRVRAPTTSTCMPFPGSPHTDSQRLLPKDWAVPD
ncbi:hypothetical protein H8959_019764 [Pygathrix nigripes]